METLQTVREYIQGNLLLQDENVVFLDDDNIFELGYVNSLFAMKLIVFLENQFGIVVETDDMEIDNFSSVKSIISFIHHKTNK